MIILGLSQRSGHTRVVLRVVILATLLQGVGFAQTTCTLSNGLATGFFGGVDVSGSFTIGATPDKSSITVSGDPNSVYKYSYTFSGPLDGAGYTQTSKIPPVPCIVAGCPPGGTVGPGQATFSVYPNDTNTEASLGFEDTGEIFTGYGTLSCTSTCATGSPEIRASPRNCVPPPPPVCSGQYAETVYTKFPGTVYCGVSTPGHPASPCLSSTDVPPGLGNPCLVSKTPKDSQHISFEAWCGDFSNDTLANPPRAITCNHCWGLYEKQDSPDSDPSPPTYTIVGKCWFPGAWNIITVAYDNREGAPPGNTSCWTSSNMKNFQTDASGDYALYPDEPQLPAPINPLYLDDGWQTGTGSFYETWWYNFNVNKAKLSINIYRDPPPATLRNTGTGVTFPGGNLNPKDIVWGHDPASGGNFNDIPPVLYSLPANTGTMSVESASQLCDLNGDGVCNAADTAIFKAALGSCVGDAAYSSWADANMDGCVNITDQGILFPADLNLDGKVDCADLAIVTAAFGKTFGQTGFDSRADVIVDGVIDIRDLAFVSQYLPQGTACH